MLYLIKKNGWSALFVFGCRTILLAAIFTLGGAMTGGLAAFAAGDDTTVRVGYYENEIFEEGAAEGAVKTGYAS